MKNDQQELKLPSTHPIDDAERPRQRRGVSSVAALVALCVTIGAAATYTWRGASSSEPEQQQLQQNHRRIQQEPTLLDEEPPLENPPDLPTTSSQVEIGIPGPTEDLGGSLIAAQFSPDPHAEKDKLQMILSSELILADIRYGPHAFTKKDSGEEDFVGGEIYGDFCVYDMNLNRASPSDYPGVRDILGNSDHCGDHRYSLPLRDIVSAVREYDADPTNTQVHSVPVSGILFHEGRSGATLVSNALAIAQPETTRVISEHNAILEALQVCDRIRNKYRSEDCDPTKQQQLLKDVVMLLSRTSDQSITNLYLKIQSAGTSYLRDIRSAFPEAPWAFFYRDADVALAKATQRKRNACIKQRRSPTSAMRSFAESNAIDMEAVSNHEICAMHLASLVRTAVEEHTSSNTGRLVSYDDDLLDSGIDGILATLSFFGINVANDDSARKRVASVLEVNANVRGRPDLANRSWSPNDDVADVTEEVRSASDKFLKATTLQMERTRARSRL